MRSVLDKETVYIDVLKDVDTTTTPPADTNVLQWQASSGKWVPGSGSAGSGETNTASNINTGGGYGVFDTKTGVDLKFRGINVGSSKLTVTFNGVTGEIEIDLGSFAIDYLTDVDTTTTAPVLDDILQFDGSNWVPAQLPTLTVSSLDDLSDVDVTTITPNTGDHLVYDGTNWAPDAMQLAQQVDFDGNYVYQGEAQPGSNTSSAVWRITRTEFTGEDSETLFADGDSSFNNVWDNRASLTYS